MTTLENGICPNGTVGSSDTVLRSREIFVQVVDRKGNGVGGLGTRICLTPTNLWTDWQPLPIKGTTYTIVAQGSQAQVSVKGMSGDVLVSIIHDFDPTKADRIVFVLCNVG